MTVFLFELTVGWPVNGRLVVFLFVVYHISEAGHRAHIKSGGLDLRGVFVRVVVVVVVGNCYGDG